MKVGDQKVVQVAKTSSWYPVRTIRPDFAWIFGTDDSEYPIRLEDNERPKDLEMLILEVVADGDYMKEGDRPGPLLWTIVKD